MCIVVLASRLRVWLLQDGECSIQILFTDVRTDHAHGPVASQTSGIHGIPHHIVII